jgi:hypothetical protein
MLNFKKSKEEVEIWAMLKNYFVGDGMEKLAQLQAKYNQEEHFKQIELKRKREIEERYNYLKAMLEAEITLSEQETNDYKYFKFVVTGSL